MLKNMSLYDRLIIWWYLNYYWHTKQRESYAKWQNVSQCEDRTPGTIKQRGINWKCAVYFYDNSNPIRCETPLIHSNSEKYTLTHSTAVLLVSREIDFGNDIDTEPVMCWL